jgi:2-amino-4-hydroxy-6-hydroxymethyldihydropteridine diphosphokinase
MKKTYLSIGGNIGPTSLIIIEAFEKIKALPCVKNALLSNLYKTTPVGLLEQRYFINAAIVFDTSYHIDELFYHLQAIEVFFKKEKKDKNGPRTLDIDILFFGDEEINNYHLIIPHPRWRERLFVLKPLLDLIKEIFLPSGEYICIKTMIDQHTNPHQETVIEIKAPIF